MVSGTRGTVIKNKDLSQVTWLRVGGPADLFFMPADIEDLIKFLKMLPNKFDIFPIGVGSNLIIRDGGIRGAVIRLGSGFKNISFENNKIVVGASALDAHVASKAADNGLDLTFLRTIPGSIGGAIKMNAGCYGSYVEDFFVSAKVINRSGELFELSSKDMKFSYRQCNLPQDCIILEATFEANYGNPEALHLKMKHQLVKRDETQPTKERTAGSTFRNPSGFSSTGEIDDLDDFKAWKLIDDAGMRGATCGGAKISEKHSNFLINTGTATANDLESLGEQVRKSVFQKSKVKLQWEVIRIGETNL
jgi:UDP-N-acetylmuramate dehydrogenase